MGTDPDTAPVEVINRALIGSGNPPLAPTTPRPPPERFTVTLQLCHRRLHRLVTASAAQQLRQLNGLTRPCAGQGGSRRAARVPLDDAYRQAGINLSPAGAPVTAPVSPSRLIFGDIGQFTDHRVMALGDDKVWVNGQVTPLEQLQTGPNFLGWEHPAAPAPAQTVVATSATMPVEPKVSETPPFPGVS